MGAQTFTAEQDAVANHTSGHALVSAVAGSGKTTTLVERVGRLVDAGVEPSAVLCLMFNKSAQEAFQRKLWKETTDACMAAMKANGVEVISPDLESFRKACAPVTEGRDYLVVKKALAEIREVK